MAVAADFHRNFLIPEYTVMRCTRQRAKAQMSRVILLCPDYFTPKSAICQEHGKCFIAFVHHYCRTRGFHRSSGIALAIYQSVI